MVTVQASNILQVKDDPLDIIVVIVHVHDKIDECCADHGVGLGCDTRFRWCREFCNGIIDG